MWSILFRGDESLLFTSPLFWLKKPAETEKHMLLKKLSIIMVYNDDDILAAAAAAAAVVVEDQML